MKRNTEYFAYDYDFADTARRFEESSLSLLDLAAFDAAASLLLEVGMKVVEERVLTLSAKLAEGLQDRGFKVLAPWPRQPQESSGIVSFRKPGAPAHEPLRDLTASGIVGSVRSDFVRLSPHFYNTESEVDRVLDVLAPEPAESR